MVVAERTPPHNLYAEGALLGAVILSRNAIEAVADTVVPGDFYRPANAIVYEAVLSLYRSGEVVDLVTVTDRLSKNGVLDDVGGPSALVDMIQSTPSTTSAAHYAKIIAEASVLRRVIAVATQAAEQAYDAAADADQVVRSAQDGFSEALSGLLSSTPEDLWVLDEFLNRPMEERPQWVIEGLLREGWRVIVVAQEGTGKTILLRQLGVAAAQGIHPLHFAKIDPVRTLIVDLENSEDSVYDSCNPIRTQATMQAADYDPDRAWLWHRPGGINLRARRDRMEFETVVATCKPDLVCMGPIYKCYSVTVGESDEQAAKEVMQCLDDLRTRYNFALVLEHHAAKGTGAKRDLSPYGTSLWLRWPEIGISLNQTDSDARSLRLGRWRGDRLVNDWPAEIVRGSGWMWEGVWPDGTFNNAPVEPATAPADDYFDEDPRF